ncbi:FAD-linked oxidoreductase [Heliocybe sulcata]|uniref:Proline dehydrogenase n=1 Tax=Heliocybe sulcata TaxID=5364 RepID=A0A5C3NNG3_9AGAM|nr:FAD-linked oxidoreductase [Heliocybe sulcata]
MSFALLARQSLAPCRPRSLPWRGYHHIPQASREPDTLTRLTRLGLLSGAIVGGVLAYGPSPVYSDAPEPEGRKRSQASLATLIRSYVVFSACSVPFLVDSAPTVLSAMMAVPGVRQVAEAVVRVTFFKHFVGGDTAEDCIPLLEQYRAERKGCLFAYSVEVDENEASGKAIQHGQQAKHKQGVAEMIHSIDVAADFEARHVVNPADPSKGRRTWVAVKLTALLSNAQALISLSKHLVQTRPATPDIPFPGLPSSDDLDVLYDKSSTEHLSATDIAELRELHEDLVRICTRAKERGVRVIMDAEYSWYQPAIDAYAHALMREFNKLSPCTSPSSSLQVQPLVYQTYQAYLRRTPQYLATSITQSRRGNYALGVKLVRGAYHPHEIAAHPSAPTPSTTTATSDAELKSLSISPDPQPPVWQFKHETDACYKACSSLLIDCIKNDIEQAKGGLWRKGKATEVPRIGVLFGTHNWESAKGVLELLADPTRGLAQKVKEHEGGEEVFRIGEEVTERLTMGQLYGMCDELTDYLVDKTRCSAPFVIKYIPYGALSEVMPYLSRRAIENKSVLGDGAAATERKRAWAEIRKHLFG